MNRKVYGIGKWTYYSFPFLQPILRKVKKILKIEDLPTFSGWGMTTIHELPWMDGSSKIFLKTKEDIKNESIFSHTLKEDTGIDSSNVDSLLWRHWNVIHCIRYAFKNYDLNKKIPLFVECGVGDGLSAFFALRELNELFKNSSSKYFMHLYDSWGPMRENHLHYDEKSNANRYQFSSDKVTKKNLSEFKNFTRYFKGYIPETFDESNYAISEIVYLHIDLNSAKSTVDSLNFFYPKLSPRGVILFDDYGWKSYKSTKEEVDKFLSDKNGILHQLPTGQAIFYKFT